MFEYETLKSEPHAVPAKNINAYLVDAPDISLENRSSPLCNVPAMRFGSMPRDGGNLILVQEERDVLLAKEPQAVKWVRPYTGAQEFLNGEKRWCPCCQPKRRPNGAAKWLR
ncbi:MAG TPA: hypothetical protein PLW81_14565 [Thiobacillaceae bacterium]|nr:hypothetical protein [Thiobacillaceae bacterium]